MNVEDVKKLTVEKLKVELKSRDLDTTGKKAELAERLEAHLQAQPEPSAQANGASTSAPAPASSSAPASGKARKPIVWSAASAEGTAADSEAPRATAAADPAAAEPSNTDAAETDLSAEASEEEKRKARAKKFGVVDDTAPAESVKRKAGDPEAVALVSDDIVAKRQARFKTAEESAEEQRRQRFMDPDTVKAKERKERFGKWLPTQESGKTSKDDVAAAIGTSLDNSVAAKGRGRGKSNTAALKEEKYSAEFMAKAEARKARFAGKK